MKSFNKVISFLILFVLASFFECHQSESKEIKEFLLKFLSDPFSEGNQIKTETCLDNPLLLLKTVKFDPPEIEKGRNVKMKVIGAMLEDTIIKGLFIQAFLNKNKMFEKEIPKNESVKKGIWSYEYEVGVPKFVPTGNWETYVYVRDDKDKDISCVKVLFDI